MSRRNHRRTGSAWHASKNKDRERMAEIDRRVLTDLDDCRRVWEQHADPLALLVGVLMAEVLETWPTWLVDGLVLALCAEDAETKLEGLRLGPRWAAKHREMADAKRAATVLALRHHPDKREKWVDAQETAGERQPEVAGTDPVSAETVRKSYGRAIKGLADDGAYWQAPPGVVSTRLHMALEKLPAAHRARLE